MSKIRLILAVILIAFAICLPGCHKSDDSKVTSTTARPESGTDQIYSQMTETTAESKKPTENPTENPTETPTSGKGSESTLLSGNKGEEQVSGSASTKNEKHDAQPNDESSATQNGAKSQKQEKGKTGSNAEANRNNDYQSSQKSDGSSKDASHAGEEQWDNAEVNFNDL